MCFVQENISADTVIKLARRWCQSEMEEKNRYCDQCAAAAEAEQ